MLIFDLNLNFLMFAGLYLIVVQCYEHQYAFCSKTLNLDSGIYNNGRSYAQDVLILCNKKLVFLYFFLSCYAPEASKVIAEAFLIFSA